MQVVVSQFQHTILTDFDIAFIMILTKLTPVGNLSMFDPEQRYYQWWGA